MNDNFKKIDDYLNKKLSADVEKSFEQEFSQNEKLKEDIKIQFFLEEALREQSKDILKKQIQSFRLEEKKKNKVISLNKAKAYWQLGIAASIALIVGVSLLLMFPKATESQQLANNLYEENFDFDNFKSTNSDLDKTSLKIGEEYLKTQMTIGKN